MVAIEWTIAAMIDLDHRKTLIAVRGTMMLGGDVMDHLEEVWIETAT